MVVRIGNIIGYMLVVLGFCELFPIVVALSTGEHSLILPFFISALFTVFVGGALYLSFQNPQDRASRHEVILVMVVIWLGVPLFASLPFMITGFMTKLTDAYFEATSALTTTGSSLVVNLDLVPQTILFWRAFLQWIGGVLVFSMAVAILPLSSIGGLSLFRSVLPHGEGDDLLARIRYAFTPLFKVYLMMTVACILLLVLSGMGGFEAMLLSMATLSSGGFTSQGMAGGNMMRGITEFILMPFMLFAATNMTFHWAFLQRGRVKLYRQDPEIRHFYYILMVAVLFIFLSLVTVKELSDVGIWDKIRIALFTAVSSISTTGFLPDQATRLPLAVVVICMILLFVGGTTGSTAGGFKILRINIMKRLADKEISRLTHPSGVTPVTFGDQVVRNDTMVSIWALLFLFIAALAVVTIIYGSLGYSLQTSFGLSGTSLFSAGGLIPVISPDFVGYHSLSYAAKWVSSFTMILGRLEVIAILVLFMPSFWKN
ncbi:TrkH family potassium uptake protein [Paremcibacter congregatus]|mgnify:CR=1 FL=1|uniref:TrkH family potassium uptake protein n=1 Tax=Paremcibacter congregatus TaxID=2043170 RepID=UPI0030EDFE7E|tara:strand:+ start:3748 stop:5208 length:1461 start_codon:yes stop_codon:yes gene_type:complete